MIGFCNIDYKENYFRLSRANKPYSWVGVDDNDNVLAIVCYVVDVSLHGKGVATALLEGICNYSAEYEIDYIEAYPALGKFNTIQCGGPWSMYKKQGFFIVDNKEEELIVRKRVSIKRREK